MDLPNRFISQRNIFNSLLWRLLPIVLDFDLHLICVVLYKFTDTSIEHFHGVNKPCVTLDRITFIIMRDKLYSIVHFFMEYGRSPC